MIERNCTKHWYWLHSIDWDMLGCIIVTQDVELHTLHVIFCSVYWDVGIKKGKIACSGMRQEVHPRDTIKVRLNLSVTVINIWFPVIQHGRFTEKKKEHFVRNTARLSCETFSSTISFLCITMNNARNTTFLIKAGSLSQGCYVTWMSLNNLWSECLDGQQNNSHLLRTTRSHGRAETIMLSHLLPDLMSHVSVTGGECKVLL